MVDIRTKEFTIKFNIPQGTIAKWCREGKIPGIKVKMNLNKKDAVKLYNLI